MRVGGHRRVSATSRLRRAARRPPRGRFHGTDCDALLLCVLLASASYIAVPAALRIALPDANPGVYVPMALALTFPFNIAVGIPLYMSVIEGVWVTA